VESISKIVMIVEYDGTGYGGFQWQSNAPTIQGMIEESLYKLTGKSIRIAGASRTDAGVHAKGQVVSFTTESSFSMEVWGRALNYYLPRDIVVREVYEMGDEFNVRRNATSREYHYSIINNKVRSPLRGKFSYLIAHPLDVVAMNQACQVLEGQHDFAPFCSPTKKTTMRNVFWTKVCRDLDWITFKICASSFLPHQVRNTVGGLVRVGLGKMAVEDFKKVALSGQAGVVGPMAPANALCLMQVQYPNFSPDAGEKDENLYS